MLIKVPGQKEILISSRFLMELSTSNLGGLPYVILIGLKYQSF